MMLLSVHKSSGQLIRLPTLGLLVGSGHEARLYFSRRGALSNSSPVSAPSDLSLLLVLKSRCAPESPSVHRVIPREVP